MILYLQTRAAMSADEIGSLYARAEAFNVGIVLFGNTPSPSEGPAEWQASGNFFALRRFIRETGVIVIPKPQYPAFRWSDKNRWEKD